MMTVNGFSIGADYNFFFADIIGIGGKFSIFQRIKDHSDKKQRKIIFHQTIKESFLGPRFTLRIPLKQKSIYLFSAASYGPVFFEDFLAFSGNSFTLLGKTNGLSLDFGVDLRISEKKKKYIGFMVSFLGAVLKEYEMYNVIEGYPMTGPINISRVDFSLGYRFY